VFRRTSKWAVLATTLSLAMALLVVAACSGGGNTSSSTATPKSTAAGSTAHTGGATSTATQQPASTTSSGSDLSQLQSLGGNLKQAKGKVTYDLTDTKSDGTVTTSSFTIYSDPPNSRFDVSNATSGLTSFIETPSGSYSCSASTQKCIGFSTTSSTGVGLLSGLFTPDVINSYISKLTGVSISKSSDTIAGVSATCYSWQNAQTSVATSGKVCFSGDGLMLSVDSTDATGSKTSLKASAVSTTISAADFQPPYPVTTTLP
jgi:hypothetical protein